MRRLTIDEVADMEEEKAEKWEELFPQCEEADFLRADAAERRRLGDIIRREEEKEKEETENLRKSLIEAKKRRSLKNV